MILVNDGSKDKTWELMKDIVKNKYPKHYIIGVNYAKNGGKGFAVRSVRKINLNLGNESL